MTGTAPQEGKTTTLVNLAQLLAASGEETLVIDCDLRRAQLHSRLGLTREPGLTDHFVQHQPLETADPQDAHAAPVRADRGHAAAQPARAARAQEHGGAARPPARRPIAWVLIDSPPLVSVTDALLLARIADCTVFVVQHNTVDKRLIKRSVTALRKVGGERAWRRAELDSGIGPGGLLLLLVPPDRSGRRADEPAGGQERLTA